MLDSCFSCNISKRCICFDNLTCVILWYLQSTPDLKIVDNILMSFLDKLTVQMDFDFFLIFQMKIHVNTFKSTASSEEICVMYGYWLMLFISPYPSHFNMFNSELIIIDHVSITYRSNKSNQNNRSLIDQTPERVWSISVRLVKLINRLLFENWSI